MDDEQPRLIIKLGKQWNPEGRNTFTAGKDRLWKITPVWVKGILFAFIVFLIILGLYLRDQDRQKEADRLVGAVTATTTEVQLPEGIDSAIRIVIEKDAEGKQYPAMYAPDGRRYECSSRDGVTGVCLLRK